MTLIMYINEFSFRLDTKKTYREVHLRLGGEGENLVTYYRTSFAMLDSMRPKAITKIDTRITE